jgi:hypothetical protein
MSGGLGWEIRVLASGHWIVEKDCFISLGMTSTITSQRLRRRSLTKIYNLALGECQFSIRAVVLEETLFFVHFYAEIIGLNPPRYRCVFNQNFLEYIYIIFKHFHFENSRIDILLDLNFKLNCGKITII